ncbi:MAG: hypothetical protein AAF710_00455 [Planctomycetota bacterium]
MSDRTNKPVHEVRIGAIKAAIWANATDNGSTRYAVTVARIYRDRNSQWQQTTSFGVDDLPVLQKVIDQAFEAVLNLQGDPGNAPDPGSNDGGNDDPHAATAPAGDTATSGNSRELQASGTPGDQGKARRRG